jgi:hypothetical protein
MPTQELLLPNYVDAPVRVGKGQFMDRDVFQVLDGGGKLGGNPLVFQIGVGNDDEGAVRSHGTTSPHRF